MMKVWIWMLVAFVHFINVSSLPAYRESSLEEYRQLNARSALPSRASTESGTALILPQEIHRPDKEPEILKKIAEADLGYVGVQSERTLRSVLWSWPSHLVSITKRQITCGNNSQCGNGANSTGNGDGSNNTIESGGGGSSQTDRNIALGVGLGVGLPGAIVAMVTIFNCFRTR